MDAPRLLRVRCATWDQVEAFYRRKLRRSGRLAMRVPFPGPIKDYGNSLPNLVAYCDRMRDRYYPDFA